MRNLFALAAIAALISSAQAAPPASWQQRQQEILKQTPGAEAFFAADDRGGFRHIGSSLECMPVQSNVVLKRLILDQLPTGKRAGCYFDRLDKAGNVRASLQFLIIKAPPGLSLEDATAAARREFEPALATPKVDQEGYMTLQQQKGAPPSNEPPTRYGYAVYNVPGAAPKQHAVVMVFLHNGWLIDIRTTFPVMFGPEDEGYYPGNEAFVSTESLMTPMALTKALIEVKPETAPAQ